jgi:cytochrome b involved in lipid metabolism
LNISIEDFNIRIRKGEELVILDDMVLDISKYKFKHPGGKFVMQ